MLTKIHELHDKILSFLIKWKNANEDFTFVLRKSNFGKKLSEGYWFYGNKELVVLSFWTGMDWKAKIPNISFCYNLIDQETYIQISVKDSIEKRNVVGELFSSQFEFDFHNDTFYLNRSARVTENKILKNLELFLIRDKLKIDHIINENKRLFQTKQNTRNRIGFISENDFQKNLRRTLNYRERQSLDILPISLVNLSIKAFGPITSLDILNLPSNAQWVFLTGENGTGKTSILKAIATALTNGTLGLGPRTTVSNTYNIGMTLNKYGRLPKHRIKRIPNNTTVSKKQFQILSEGFVAFGPVRLNISEEQFLHKIKISTSDISLDKPYLHLFNTNGFLIDIGTLYNRSAANQLIKGNDDKIRYIIEAITKICDTIVDIHFGRSVRYYEVDKNNNLLNNKGTNFIHLASGYKSIIAMVSHMMLHLFYQQPKINDPSELVGIVIIDEIDLHFHPKMQKDLVIRLTEIFPKVQFIVSTHSPIPLLGAPLNSVILTVERDSKKGVYVKRMDDRVAFENLMPNSLLTSPIFGLSDISPSSHKPDELLRVEDTYDQITFNDRLEKEIEEFITDAKEKQLLTLFTSKNK